MNDCVLCYVNVGLGGIIYGVFREDGFNIIVVLEIMVILCLSWNIKDLKEKISWIIIGYICYYKFIIVFDLKVEGVLILIFKDVIKLNLV